MHHEYNTCLMFIQALQSLDYTPHMSCTCATLEHCTRGCSLQSVQMSVPVHVQLCMTIYGSLYPDQYIRAHVQVTGQMILCIQHVKESAVNHSQL